MTMWQQWIMRPHGLWLRRLSFQIHLWLGLAFALYIIVLSLTGSILVYRAELTRALDVPGESFPGGIRALLWARNLHDDLLLGRNHRALNGAGAIAATLLTLTGLIVWWPGVRSVRRAVTVKWRARPARLNRDLHSAAGFWLSLFLLNWTVTAIYLAFPAPFGHLVDILSVAPPTTVRWGDIALDWLTQLHFGRWSNPALKALWCFCGLVPGLLAVTGGMMWWARTGRVRTAELAARFRAGLPGTEWIGLRRRGETTA